MPGKLCKLVMCIARRYSEWTKCRDKRYTRHNGSRTRTVPLNSERTQPRPAASSGLFSLMEACLSKPLEWALQ